MRIFFITLLAVLVSGCSSIFNTTGSDDFSCPGMPKGVSCKSPREVYKLTEKDKVKKVKGKSSVDMPTYVFATSPRDDSKLNPVPVLEQARVMRIWIGPWTDRNNDQHWPGLVFTVIQPKQWHFGHQEFDGVEPPVPHKMFESAPAAPAADSTTGSADLPKNEEVLN